MSEYLTLKWGGLKSWSFESPEALALLDEFFEEGQSLSAAAQRHTSRQREILCELIDLGSFETVWIDWNGEEVSKEEAKRYVREYRRDS